MKIKKINKEDWNLHDIDKVMIAALNHLIETHNKRHYKRKK